MRDKLITFYIILLSAISFCIGFAIGKIKILEKANNDLDNIIKKQEKISKAINKNTAIITGIECAIYDKDGNRIDDIEHSTMTITNIHGDLIYKMKYNKERGQWE